MEYQKALIALMKAKIVIISEINPKFTYFKRNDGVAIKGWSDDIAKTAWDCIANLGRSYDEGLSNDTCPFCKVYWKSCDFCEYKEARDDLSCYDPDSNFRTEYVNKNDVYKSINAKLNDKWFKKTLKAIAIKYKLDDNSVE